MGLQGNMFPDCIQKLWNKNGCTTLAPKNIGNITRKNKHFIKKIADSYKNKNSTIKDWERCFGKQNLTGFGSDVSYLNTNNKTNESKFIKCIDCDEKLKRKEGIWLL